MLESAATSAGAAGDGGFFHAAGGAAGACATTLRLSASVASRPQRPRGLAERRSASRTASLTKRLVSSGLEKRTSSLDGCTLTSTPPASHSKNSDTAGYRPLSRYVW